MITRKIHLPVSDLLQNFPAVAILGPRQVGKTTLALQIGSELSIEPIYLDLETPSDVAKLSEPELYFELNKGRTIILDEIQRVPEIFTVLRGEIDRRKRAGQKTGQFLILGSASLDLLQQSSETLAGRIAYVKLSGLKITEVPLADSDKLWLRGGFPESFLARSDNHSFQWRQSFISTYLERDVPQFGVRVPAFTLRQFWTMLAYVQGSILNLSKLAGGLGISVPAVSRYLDLLEDLFLVRKLAPWSSNIGKRLVRTPKVFIRDSGIAFALLKIKTFDDLLVHPVLGGSWEGYVIENIVADLPEWVSYFFYRTSAGAEIDLVVEINHKKRIAIEIKRTLSPKLSKGFLIGCEDIEATHRYFVYPGQEKFPLSKDVWAMPLVSMMDEITRLINETLQE